MLDQILVGGAASLVNLVIHAVLISGIVRMVQGLRLHDTIMPSGIQRTVVIVATGTLLVAGHFLEVNVWAWTYALVHAAKAGSDLVYFAFVNYTTLGDNNVLPVERWRLLVPMTALNGIMLIGWSTALILEVLRRTAPAPRRD